jgi:hypothetical protein
MSAGSGARVDDDVIAALVVRSAKRRRYSGADRIGEVTIKACLDGGFGL